MADDLADEVILAFAHHWRSQSNPYGSKSASELRRLAYGIARNLIADLYSSRASAEAAVSRLQLNESGISELYDCWPDLPLEDEDLLVGLSERQQVIFRLRSETGAGVAEIAEQLGISESSVKTHIRRGRLQLRKRVA